MPFRWASAIPRFTPSVQPKSSAFTIKLFTNYLATRANLSFRPDTQWYETSRAYH
jgi:hypothetical protein